MKTRMNLVATRLAACAVLVAATAAHAQTTFTKITTGPVVSDAARSFSAAWVDLDGDGDLDLYVSNANGANLLYQNDGHGGFTKITTGPIVNVGPNSYSTAWADINNDGRIDLYIAKPASAGLLFTQQSDGTFGQNNLASTSNQGTAWGDYNLDGFVDLLVTDNAAGAPWRNNGQAGFSGVTGTGMDVSGDAITWADYDGDGDPDVFVAEGPFSGGGNSRLYRNDGNGVFTLITSGELAQRGTFVTAVAWGDIDNDGFLDLFLPRANSGQALASFLFHNNRDGTFTQVEQSPFTDDTGFAISCSWADYDNDGWLDLFVAERNGVGPNRLYRNQGDGTFERVLSGPIATDIGQCAGSSWGDYDRDGFLDLFVATSVGGSGAQPNDYLYHNDGNSNAWLTIKCVGTGSNRSAIGAKVRVKVTSGGKTFWQLREINTGDGWAGNPLEAHFGLGNATNVETLRIEWPSGTVQEFQNVAAKQYLTVTEPSRLLVSATNGMPQLTLHGGRNLQYDIQTSTNFTAWSSFTSVTITNLNGTALIADTNAPSSVARFYRAVLR